jgi:integrase
MPAMPRQHGTGRIYVKWGSYYGRWRTPDGRYVNPRLGKVRERGEQDGLSRRAAERVLRRLLDVVSVRPAPTREERPRTVDDAADTFRERLVIEGARLSYRQNCESMQRVHISPGLGRRRVDAVKTEDIERLARALLAKGLAPKTVRNTMTFLHSVFALAVRKGWAQANPVTDAARPRRRRATDASPDLQFLTPRELDAVIAVIPDVVVDRDSLGPVLRLVILAAGTTGVRQSELLGMRWRDIDAVAQRVRIRNAWVRGENSGEGKSDLSTSRLVPMTDRLALELRKWRLRTVFGDDDELVFGHPELGTPAGPHEGHAALQEGLPGSRGPSDPVSRPPPHVRHDTGRRRGPAADDRRVPGPRRSEDVTRTTRRRPRRSSASTRPSALLRNLGHGAVAPDSAERRERNLPASRSRGPEPPRWPIPIPRPGLAATKPSSSGPTTTS